MMMLRQWSRRSVSSTLRRRLQQQRSVIKRTNIGGGRAAVSTIANNSSWIHERSLGNDADAHFFRLPTTAARVFSSAAEEYHPEPRPFKKLMAANRGEIATRILRAGTELGCSTVGIYSHEDRFTQHRYKADQAFQLSSDKSPVAAYLDIPTIVELCVQNGVEAVHPGYGLLSENANFAKSLEEAGVKFVGPTVDNLNTFGDKTSAKELAIKANVPIITGSDSTFSTPSEAKEWIEDPNNPITYPVIVKAAMGGGGRGIRIVPTADDLESMFRLASNEALNAFGDGRCFVEKYVDQPRHIEVQCLGDGTGNVIHLFDRDCSVQRRHQKVIETAPATGLSRETRQKIFDDAVRMLSLNKYRNAGTVEFLVDKDGNHYFMEVNPR